MKKVSKPRLEKNRIGQWRIEWAGLVIIFNLDKEYGGIYVSGPDTGLTVIHSDGTRERATPREQLYVMAKDERFT